MSSDRQIGSEAFMERTSPFLWVTFAAIAALKIAFLLRYGPIHTPDTGAYIAYARQIVASDSWLHNAGLADTAIPLLAMRMAGYPAFLAGAMVTFGEAWPYAVVLFQFTLSFVTAYAIYRICLELGLSSALAVAITAANLLSLALTFDQCLLTDSLDYNLIILATVALAHGAAAGKPLTWQQALLAGVLFTLAFLIREALQFLIIVFVPLALVRVWISGRANWRGSVVGCLLIFLPVFAAVQAYKSWNEYRTGERFVTTVPQLTVLFALGKMVSIDPDIFSGDTPVDRAGKRYFKNDPFGEISPVNSQLFNEGYKATDIARMAYAKYFSTWRERPLTMLRLFNKNTSEKAVKLTVRPIGAICETIEYGSGKRTCYDYRDLYRAIPSVFVGVPKSAIVFFFAQSFELTISVLIFAGFLFGTPIIFIRRFLAQRRAIDCTSLVLAAFWCAYVGWGIAYGIVHVEDRYMAPVLPLSLICGIYAWREAWYHYRNRFRPLPQTGGSAPGMSV
jgi:hypothetical protein